MHLNTDKIIKEKNLTGHIRFLCCSVLILAILLTACAGGGAGTGSAAGNAEAGS